MRRGQGDASLHSSPRDFISNSSGTVTTAAVPQQYNRTSASNSGLVTATVLLCSYVCAAADIYTCSSSDHIHFTFTYNFNPTHVVEPHPDSSKPAPGTRYTAALGIIRGV